VRRARHALAALAGGIALGCAGSAPRTASAPPAEDLVLTLKPVRGGAPEVTAVEVRAEIKGPLPQTTRPFTVSAPIVYAGRTGIADRVDGLAVRDARGEVPLAVEDDPVNRGGFPFYRHWRAQREVVPQVVVTHRMKAFTGTATVGPQFDFYSHSGGISSGGMALFALPESLGVMTARVRFDLSDLAKGSIAASTYGEGDFVTRGPASALWQAYYMAGPLGRYASPDAGAGFHAYWLGQPAFDAAREAAWAYESYRYQRTFFRDTSTSSYRVFIRALPGTGGGTALRNSFMLGTAPARASAGADSATRGPRGTIAHEMGHMFVGGLSGGPPGGTPWFAEGLNVYYTRLLLLRSGLAPVSDYERDVNNSARAYFSNPFRNASADSLLRVGFSAGVGGGSAQNVAYTRGSLYFADVDAKIRAASAGRRKLDDVILPLFERRRRGERIDQRAFVDALVAELGPSAREQFEAAVLRGEAIVPDAGAFGPCLERRPAKYTAAGREVDGYEWVRVTSIPDERCREW
jgi:hypothetical protein